MSLHLLQGNRITFRVTKVLKKEYKSSIAFVVQEEDDLVLRVMVRIYLQVAGSKINVTLFLYHGTTNTAIVAPNGKLAFFACF